jgi:tripartite-type tricarboxylate transporter receptor subunit TctC
LDRTHSRQANVICQYRNGAAGTVAAAYVYNVAPNDGTVVGQILSASSMAPILRGAKYDATKFIWVGSMSSKPAVVSVWADGPATTIESIKKTEVIVRSSGKTSETYMIPALMNVLLGAKFKVITGYRGEDILLAMERGEIHGRQAPWTSFVTVRPQWIRDNKIVTLIQYGPPIKELSNVPHLRDLLTETKHKQMIDFMEVSPNVGLGIYLPPSTPADKATALRSSFLKAMQDPTFLADAKKRKVDIGPIPGETVQAMVAKAYSAPKPVLDELRKLIGLEEKAKKQAQ